MFKPITPQRAKLIIALRYLGLNYMRGIDDLQKKIDIPGLRTFLKAKVVGPTK